MEPHDFDNVIKFTTLQIWQNQWNHSDLGRFCYGILPNVKLKPWYSGINCDRSFIKNMSRLISNHFTLNAHLFRIKITQTNLCECNEDYEHFDHILWNCHKYTDSRITMQTALSRIGRPLNTPIRDVLGTMDIPAMRIINNFILNAKIKI